MEDNGRMVTRSQGRANPDAEDEANMGHIGSNGRDEDVRSVVHSRSSRKSTRSSNAAITASEQRLETSRHVMELQKKLNDVLRSLRVAELCLTKKQTLMKKIMEKIEKIEDICSEEYLEALESMKKVEEEEEELKTQIQLLKIDETFASLDLKAAQKLSTVADEHAQVVLVGVDDDDNSQKLSDDEDDSQNQFDDALSVFSRESEYRRLVDKLQDLRGDSVPPTSPPQTSNQASHQLAMNSTEHCQSHQNPDLTSQQVMTNSTEQCQSQLNANSTSQPVATNSTEQGQSQKNVDAGAQPMVQQLVDVLSQAFGQINPMMTSNRVATTHSTNEKMLARQAMKMELSPFDGNSSEWPIFIQQYQTVSEACGFSNVENLHRLQRALKGEARAAVSALLMCPDNVPKILTVLEERFGNPRLVVQRLVEQAQGLSAVKEGDHKSFLHFVDTVRNLASTAEAMKCAVFLANPQLITQLIKKLPMNMQFRWTDYQQSINKIYPDLTDVASWLDSVAKSVMLLYEPGCTSKIEKPYSTAKPMKPQKSFAVIDFEKKKTEIKKCRLCGGEQHHISKCAAFEAMEVEDRWKWVKTHRYCFSCLNYGHGMGDCRGKRNCGIEGCDKPHHRKLHPVEKKKPRIEVTTTYETTEVLTHAVASGRINLNILPVQIKGPRGTFNTFAMLDPGASLTVMDAELADELGFKGPTKPLTHSGLHEAITVSDSRTVDVDLVSTNKQLFKLKGVRTVPKLSLPRQSVKTSTLNRWPHLKKIPINVYEEAEPTILIGQDHVDLCNTSELVLGPGNAPAAGKTKLGWVLMGRVGAQQGGSVSYHFREETEDDLHRLVKHHFSTEAFGVKPNVEKPRSREDARAVKIMKETLQRVGVGETAETRVVNTEPNEEFGSHRWECGLLWKEDSPSLPKYSREEALRRLRQIEKKMDASKEYADIYCGKISAYIDKGYARKLSKEEAEVVTDKTYYLSHFLAKNPKKANKERFVFDAKSRTGGKSLNDCLCVGPDQLNPLPAVLFKFREKAIGVTADVKDMFHRVGVNKEDAVAQRFLWRGTDRDREPDTYQMDVLIFGATCSPAIAQEAKNKNAQLFVDQFPETVEAIIKNFYMDDDMNSFDSVMQAFSNFNETRQIMGYGNMDLRGWLSNSKEFMEQIPADLRAATAAAVELGDEDAVERVLGLFWKPTEDIFTFSLSYLRTKEDVMKGNRMPTKRELLALVMSLYDPLGFISHFTVRGKMLLQDCWRSKIGWDDEIQESSRGKWEQWRDALMKIPEFSLKRCYSLEFSTAKKITLHVFADASEQAYGAVAYFVTHGTNGKEVSLVNSKARVAPLKPLSIPRMELQAAVLGARLATFIKEEHTVPVTRTVFWSDSQTVLCWLQGDGRKFQQFVAHRIGEIQELTNPDEWRWVPTKINVADEMTRDGETCDWTPSSRWVNGPEFLLEDEENWPVSKEVNSTKEDPEMKKEFLCVAVEPNDLPIIRVEDYSSWKKLIRVTARLFQFIRIMKKEVSQGIFTIKDIDAAETYWRKTVQQEAFTYEKNCMEKGLPLPKSSKVRGLELMMDQEGVLRLTGRLHNAMMDTQTKFPVLLDRKHPYTRLLISHFHEAAGHHGVESVVNELRQKYYIPHLRSAVKGSWINCQICKNNRAQPVPPLMGQLPIHRVEYGGHPFTNTGVDYFGPMEVTIGRRREKRWGALFTCLSTRAIHLEVAASLSTDSCILAIRRFVCRRGCPQRLFSDNGTNFHGANNELRKALKELDQAKMSAECTSKGIDWHFNPPSAPHMGGSWERLVRSVKVALHATLKEQAPKEEVLQTLMVEAEHSVNSHPLTHVSVDADDPEALTPNHFLIGRSSNMAPPGLFEQSDMLRKSTWRRAQHLADLFWKRWMTEYLPTLQRRAKWISSTVPVKMGDVAVEVDNQQPRNVWRKGIVTGVFPGEDGIVRVVDFKTSSGVYRRPVAKLAFLDVRRNEATPVVTKDAEAPMVSGRMSSLQDNL